MIYKKIKEAKQNLLKMNAIEAAQAGAAGTGIDLNEKKDNPITYKASPSKKTDPGGFVSKGSATFNETAGEYFERKRRELGGTKMVPGAKVEKLETDNQKYLDSFLPGFKRDNEGFDNITDYRLNKEGKYRPKEVKLPDVNFLDKKFVPDPPTEVKTPASQQYNIGEKAAEDANIAKNRIRRGLNRDERKDIKNTVQKMRTLDPSASDKYKESMKKSRKGTFLGLGIGGDRQERKIQALKDAGKLGEDYQSIKSEIADTNLKMGTEERNQKIESATMNKYNMGKDQFGDFKGGSSKSEDAPIDPNAPVIDNLDTEVVTENNSNMFSSFMKNKTFGGSLMTGFGITKKGKLGKNAAAFKNKSGRGAGY